MMATPMLSANHRWGQWRQDRREAMAQEVDRRPVKALVVNCDKRTEAERQADNAALALRLRVSRRCFI